MEKIDKLVIYWYSNIVFNALNSTKLNFRKLETGTRKLTDEKLHQKFNEICLKENLLPTFTNIYYIYVFNVCCIMRGGVATVRLLAAALCCIMRGGVATMRLLAAALCCIMRGGVATVRQLAAAFYDDRCLYST